MTDTRIQGSPVSEEDLELAIRIGRAWREIRRGANTAVVRDAIYGVGGSAIEPSQMDALDFLTTNENCRMSDLAENLRIDPSTATRAVQRMINDGLIERVPDRTDGRAVNIVMTERGQRIHDQVFERRRAVLIEVLAEFSADERHVLADLLERFNTGVEAAVMRKLRRR